MATLHVRPRARGFGIQIGRMPTGVLNAITDVPGVRVGQVTLIEGEGALRAGAGPIRTGVTAILPHSGNLFREKVAAAIHVFNGFGKVIGLAQVAELGVLETPVVLTNTLNVGIAADALVEHMLDQNPEIGITTGTVNPVVAECNDGYLNDIRGRHVRSSHVRAALHSAADGPVAEGAVGAGTGMTAFGFKGGIGTASRQVNLGDEQAMLGVLVLANFGRREDLTIADAPVGRSLLYDGTVQRDVGSIIVVVATSAPLDARQLDRVARRAVLGIARTGSTGGHGSGDFVIAFSTSRLVLHWPTTAITTVPALVDEGALDSFFQASVEATEEAIVNALLKAETTTGRDGHVREALPLERLAAVLHQYGHSEVLWPR